MGSGQMRSSEHDKNVSCCLHDAGTNKVAMTHDLDAYLRSQRMIVAIACKNHASWREQCFHISNSCSINFGELNNV